ncbi:hypothetical protein [Paenibacillus sp. HW567]|uniref:hypothetical protein n=1 Tax=Paenibacillus sp. HW567 TaxID=1034769 RepID=UPI000378F552|nr:hypothetical protein [Paenibacillus sp. HW567]
MIFESENGHRIENIQKNELLSCLRKINGTSNSYAVLETGEGNYIQVGGGPVEYTVEIRKMLQDAEFSHWKARKINVENEGIKKIIISGSVVDVKSNQVIDLDTVLKLFDAYFDGQPLPLSTEWDDITNMFL